MSRRRVVIAGVGFVALACWCGGAMGKYVTDNPDAPGAGTRLSDQSGVASLLEETRTPQLGITGSLGLGFDCLPMAPVTDAGETGGGATGGSAGARALHARGARSDVGSAAAALPTAFAFGRPAPNPAECGAVLSFDLPVASRVMIETFDLVGRRVANAQTEEFAPGRYQRTWSGFDDGGRPLPAGVYLIHLKASPVDGGLGLSAVHKILKLR